MISSFMLISVLATVFAVIGIAIEGSSISAIVLLAIGFIGWTVTGCSIHYHIDKMTKEIGALQDKIKELERKNNVE